MKQKLTLFFTVLLFGFTLNLFAQNKSPKTDSRENSPADQVNKNSGQPSNYIKINLTGIVLKNYTLQYERTLTKKISVAAAFRTMPSTTLPFKNTIIKSIDVSDTDARKTIEQLKLGNFAFTPEVRFYLNRKGWGRGFYIAPFYRYASFETNDMIFTYEDNLNVKHSIDLSGKLTSNTFGLLFGAQKMLGKHICLDLWFFGPHYGSGNGTFEGTASTPLTVAEQNDLRQQLEDLDIPFTNKTVTVTANGASLKLDGPWAGIRAGISLGVKF